MELNKVFELTPGSIGALSGIFEAGAIQQRRYGSLKIIDESPRSIRSSAITLWL